MNPRSLNRTALLFLLPSIILFTLFLFFPILLSVGYSFIKWDTVTEPVFIGLKNYADLFSSKDFFKTLANNGIFALINVFFSTVIGFLLAVAIARKIRGSALMQIVYFLPVMLPLTVTGVLFAKLLDPNFGLVNTILGKLHLYGWQLEWLANPKLTLYTIVTVAIWQYSGFTMILFLTPIKNIDSEIHDAATIDGVSEFRRMTEIIFPAVRRVVYLVVMLQTISSLKVFDLVWVMSEGGPGNASEVLGTLLYKSAFSHQKYGYASAIAVFTTVLIFLVNLVYLRFSRIGAHETE